MTWMFEAFRASVDLTAYIGMLMQSLGRVECALSVTYFPPTELNNGSGPRLPLLM